MIPSGSRFADIGSDHAYLPCYVCLHDETAFAIAGEVRPGPLKSTEQTIARYHLTDRVKVRLGDGLDVICRQDQLDTVVIAGMGGRLITDILTRGKDKLQTVKRLIVQPNTGQHIVRRFFLNHDYQIIKEMILEENDQIYEIIIAERNSGQNVYQIDENMELQFLFGPLLLKEKSSIFLKKWRLEYVHLQLILQKLQQAKTQDIRKQQKIRQRLSWMEEILQ